MSEEQKQLRVYVVDTETTAHFEAQAQPEVIELAYAALETGGLGRIFEQRYKPVKMPMTMGAMAVHHITPRDLENSPPSTEAKLPDDAAFIVGHNIDFDWKALGSPSVRRICTLALARRLWDDGDSYTLGACLYRMLPHEEARDMLKGAHNAGVDIANTYVLLKHLIKLASEGKDVELTTWGRIWAYCEQARLPRRWAFGKYRGHQIGKELNGKPDNGYHAWCARQQDMDPYLKKALDAFREGRL